MKPFGIGLVVLLGVVVIDRPSQADFTQTIPSSGREFIVHVPPSYDGSTAVPLLFMFHGLNSNSAEAASEYYDWSALADTENFIALYPDSLTFGDGKHWDIQAGGVSQDLDFVSDMLSWATANYNIRPSHIFTTGHSYGAFFSYYTAFYLNDQIAAFGEHSGGALFPGLPTPPLAGDPRLNGILLHNPDDTVVPYFLSSTLHDQLQAGGHTSVLIDLDIPDLGAHGWDKDYNDDQWAFFLSSAPDADLDDDDDVDADDIDLFRAAPFDLDGDGDIDEGDLIYMVESLVDWNDGVDAGVGTKRGDANLDGLVNATDLAVMAGSFGDSGMGWADANLNLDDVVNATDLAILAGNFGSAVGGAPVPEPITLSLLALGATGLLKRRR
ncbi:MAG: alpha/beta hydrolase-fold protein [Planctomycetota bacterium]|jgi:predicted esterase